MIPLTLTFTRMAHRRFLPIKAGSVIKSFQNRKYIDRKVSSRRLTAISISIRKGQGTYNTKEWQYADLLISLLEAAPDATAAFLASLAFLSFLFHGKKDIFIPFSHLFFLFFPSWPWAFKYRRTRRQKLTLNREFWLALGYRQTCFLWCKQR